jgi:hypothetical protein
VAELLAALAEAVYILALLIQLQVGLWLNDPAAAAASCIGRSEENQAKRQSLQHCRLHCRFDRFLSCPVRRPLLVWRGNN